jgi:hypothetical protein
VKMTTNIIHKSHNNKRARDDSAGVHYSKLADELGPVQVKEVGSMPLHILNYSRAENDFVHALGAAGYYDLWAEENLTTFVSRDVDALELDWKIVGEDFQKALSTTIFSLSLPRIEDDLRTLVLKKLKAAISARQHLRSESKHGR